MGTPLLGRIKSAGLSLALRGSVQATAGNDSIDLMIGQVLCGEPAKSRVDWRERRGEWRGGRVQEVGEPFR